MWAFAQVCVTRVGIEPIVQSKTIVAFQNCIEYSYRLEPEDQHSCIDKIIYIFIWFSVIFVAGITLILYGLFIMDRQEYLIAQILYDVVEAAFITYLSMQYSSIGCCWNAAFICELRHHVD